MGRVKAVLFDFGGVILSSPFDAFAEYEAANGLPDRFIRGLNATNPHENAWARLERNEVDIDGFCPLFEAEALAAGHTLDARAVLALLSGVIRPEMVRAIDAIKGAGLATACLTNNFVAFEDFSEDVRAEGRDDVLAKFDVIIESSKVGVRKPDPRFYEIACDALGVDPRGLRLPRRPRHQPQARPRHGHDHHQGRRPRRGPRRARVPPRLLPVLIRTGVLRCSERAPEHTSSAVS